MQHDSDSYQLTLESIPDPCIIYDNQANVVAVNQAFEEVFGWSINEIRGKPLAIQLSETKEADGKSNNSESSGGAISRNESQWKMKNGQILDVRQSISLLENPSGEPIGRLIILQNITDQKEKEQRLLASEQRLLAAFDASPVPIITYDLNGLVTYVNPAFEATFGWEKDELMGQLVDFVPEERLLEYAESSQHLLMHDQIVALDTQRFRKDGNRLDINLNSALFRDHEQNPIGSVEILQDITQRKQFENTLQQAKNAAERANRAKSIFLANMSHEIRTPMNAILGYAQIMLRDSSLQTRWKDQLSIINQSGEHLLGLIDDILELSKIESGQLSLNPRDFDLHTLVSDLGSLFILEAEHKQLQLIVEPLRNLPQFVYADDGKIRQILINLLSNAIKFTDTGTVSLSVKILDGHSATQQLEFIISDSGEGIPLQQQQHIFEYFQQANTAKERGGAGLGLAISREYARLMGGDIRVESKVGIGSTFRFDCPVKHGQKHLASTERTEREAQTLAKLQADIRILIVDDEPSNRDVILQLLLPLGLSVQEAKNGIECLENFTIWSPDIILLDLVLPDLNGGEVARRIRELPSGQDVIIIVVSASGSHSEYFQSAMAHCDGFLSKPFRYEDLIKVISSHSGINITYGEKDDLNQLNVATSTLSQLRDDTVPRDLLTKLESAAFLGQINKLEKLIAQVEEINTAVARDLRVLANEYNYPGIRDYLLDL